MLEDGGAPDTGGSPNVSSVNAENEPPVGSHAPQIRAATSTETSHGGSAAPTRAGLAKARVLLVADSRGYIPDAWTLNIEPRAPHWRDADPDAELRALEEMLEREEDAASDDITTTDAEDGDEDDDDNDEDDDDDTPGPPWSLAVSGHEVEVELAVGRYRLSAESVYTEARPVEVLLRDGEVAEVQLSVERVGKLAGTVTSGTGSNLAGLPVLLVDVASGRQLQTQVEDDGTFGIDRIAAGHAWLAFGSWERPILARQKIEIVPPLTELGLVELPTLADLTVLVLNSQGQPVDDVRVVAAGKDRGISRQSTGSDGAAVLRHLPVGDVRLIALKGPQRRALDIVTLAAGGGSATLTLPDR